MAGKTAILSVKIISDATKAQKGFKTTATKAQKFAGAMKKAAVPAALLTAGIAKMATSFDKAGRAAADSNDKITKIAKNTGNFGKNYEKVSKRVIAHADEVARSVGVDPNAIKSAQAYLATFDDLSATMDKAGGMFDQVTDAAVDLSAAGFGSVEKASDTLAKALNEPEKGFSRLRRVGVTFTDAQKDQIKTWVESGDKAKAQAAIMKTVQDTVGGVAEATADSADIQKVKWQQLQEKIGTALIPVFDKLHEVLSKVFDFLAEHQQVVVAVVGVVGALAAGILAVNVAMKAWRAAVMVATAAQWLWNAAMSANPLGVILLAVAAVIAIIVLLVKNWDKVKEVAKKVWDAIVGWISTAIDWVKDLYTKYIQALISAFKAVGKWASDIWGSVTSGIRKVIGWVADLYRSYIERLISAFRNIGRVAKSIWSSVVGGIRNAVNWVKKLWHNYIDKLVGAFRNIGRVASNIFGGIIDSISNVIGWVQDAIGWFTNLFGASDNAAANAAEFSYGAPVTTFAPGGGFTLPGLGGNSDGPVAIRNEFNITVNGALDKAETGRTIVNLIDDYLRSNGYADTAGRSPIVGLFKS